MLKNTDKPLVVEAIPQPMGAYSWVGADTTKNYFRVGEYSRSGAYSKEGAYSRTNIQY